MSTFILQLRPFGWLLVVIWLFVCSAFQQIVHTDMIKIRQSTKDVGRNHALTAFIISISALRNIDCFADSFLRQVSILTERTDSFIFSHCYHQNQYKQIPEDLLTFRTYCSKISLR